TYRFLLRCTGGDGAAVALVCAGLYNARAGRARPEAHWPVELQGAFFATLAILTWWLKSNEVEQFIYFQF
ncbi:MAG: hypothetical protein AAF281_16010, partial [Pseudomonadota bacterium]